MGKRERTGTEDRQQTTSKRIKRLKMAQGEGTMKRSIKRSTSKKNVNSDRMITEATGREDKQREQVEIRQEKRKRGRKSWL